MYCTDLRHEAIWNARHLQPLSAFNATSSASKESAEFFNRFDRALSAMPDLVTLVITSCNRPQLLQNTLRSFVKYAVCTVDQICQFDLCADTIRILLAAESSSRTAATAQVNAMHESTPLTHVCHVIMQASTTDGSMSWSCLSSIFPYELYTPNTTSGNSQASTLRTVTLPLRGYFTAKRIGNFTGLVS